MNDRADTGQGYVVVKPFYGPPIVHSASCPRIGKRAWQTTALPPEDGVRCNTCNALPYTRVPRGEYRRAHRLV